MTRPIKPLFCSILILLCSILSINAQNQTGFGYSYDASGNRTARTIILGDDDQQKSSTSDTTKVDIEQLSDREITIYPNPTRGALRITISKIEEDEHPTYTIFTVQGTVICKAQQLTTDNTLDFSRYPNGNYLLVIHIGKEKVVRKIIKQ